MGTCFPEIGMCQHGVGAHACETCAPLIWPDGAERTSMPCVHGRVVRRCAECQAVMHGTAKPESVPCRGLRHALRAIAVGFPWVAAIGFGTAGIGSAIQLYPQTMMVIGAVIMVATVSWLVGLAILDARMRREKGESS